MFGGHAEGDGDGLMGGDLRVVVADQGDANFSRRRNSIHLVFLLNSDLRMCRTIPVPNNPCGEGACSRSAAKQSSLLRTPKPRPLRSPAGASSLATRASHRNRAKEQGCSFLAPTIDWRSRTQYWR